VVGSPGAIPCKNGLAETIQTEHEMRGEHTQKLGASALHRARVASRTIWVGLIAVLLGDLAVFLRIRVDDHADHPELLRALHLQPAEDATILDDRDLAGKADVRLDEVLKVLVRPEVGIDILGGDVAARRVAMESRDAVGQTARVVLLENVLLEACLIDDLGRVAVLLQQRQAMVQRVVEVDVVRDEAGVLDPKLLPLLSRPEGLAEVLPGQVRASRVIAAPFARLGLGRGVL